MYHVLDICQTVAQKLSNPQFVNQCVDNSLREGNFYALRWDSESLINGHPGLAIFYSTMDQLFPNEGWDGIAHKYLQIAVNEFENKGFPNCSLFNGLAGLGTAAYFCSRVGLRYKKLLEKLDNAIIEEVQNLLWKKLTVRMESESFYIAPKIYNLAEGLSGILLYISLRKDNPYLLSIGSDCIKKLSFLLKNKKVMQSSVPGWFTTPSDYLIETEKNFYPEGCFILGTPFGITGLLSAIAIAALEGFCPKEGFELLRDISSWLTKKQGVTPLGLFWNHTVSLQEELSGSLHPPQLNRDTWGNGIPSAARAIYLAGKALNDYKLKEFAENAFISLWSKPEKDWNLIGTSFNYGRAGHYAVTQRMVKETKNPELHQKLKDLESGLKNFYDPDTPFGFRSVSFSPSNEYLWIDDPGLFSGAAGIALSLLNVHLNNDRTWDRIFAIS